MPVGKYNQTIKTIDGKVDSIISDLTDFNEKPSQDSVENILIRDVVGNKTDTISGTSLVALIKAVIASQAIIDGLHDVPGQNSSDNLLLRDVAGNKTDFIGVPYSFGVNSILAHLNTSYYHVHGQSFVYPNHANGVTLTSTAGAWVVPAATTTIIPAGVLTVAPFDLHWLDIYDLDTVAEYQIDLFSGDEGEEVAIDFAITQRTSNFSREGPQPLQIPPQPEGTRISAKLSTSVAGVCTCKIKPKGHYYA